MPLFWEENLDPPPKAAVYASSMLLIWPLDLLGTFCEVRDMSVCSRFIYSTRSINFFVCYLVLIIRASETGPGFIEGLSRLESAALLAPALSFSVNISSAVFVVF